jgi:hypothetical protein
VARAATEPPVTRNFGAHVLALQRQRQRRLDKADLAAAIEARPSKVTAWNGCVPIIRAIASVSWISPPAPLPWLSSTRITSGWRM